MRSKESTWIKAYQEAGALWIHDGNPKRQHALLSSGMHSNGFFNSELVMENPHFLNAACLDLAHLLLEWKVPLGITSRVVGPAMGAITLAHDLARNIGTICGSQCLRGYTEKKSADDSTMVLKRTTLLPGEVILPAEDVLTTGGSVASMVRAIKSAGGEILPFVAVLVNRSGLEFANDHRIIALINREMPMWEANSCPLCRQGSRAIKPKGADNWRLLNTACE